MQPYATASEPSPLNGNRPVVNVNNSAVNGNNSAVNGNNSAVNGNKPVVNGNNSFFTEYRKPILYSIALVAVGLFIAVSVRGKYSWYDHGKVGTKKKSKKDKKKSRSVWKKAAATLEKKPKKGKKDSKVKPIGKCPAGCVPAGMEKKKGSKLSKTSFDPALTNKKPKVEGTRQ